MKGKRMWKRWACAVLAAVLLCTMPGTAFGAEKPEWRYGESILVEVMVDESKTFSPSDFPGVDCEKVFVLEKAARKEGVRYQLVLIPGSSKKTTLEENIKKLLALPIVTKAEKNYKFTTSQKFYLKLNHTCIYLATGETDDVAVEECYLYDDGRIYGIEFRPDPACFDMETFQKDSFSKYGVTRFWPDVQGEIWTIVSRPEELEAKKSENGYYYGMAGNANEHLFDTVARMAAAPEILFVSIFKDLVVGRNFGCEYGVMENMDVIGDGLDSEKRYDESWQMENMGIADFTLSGASNDSPMDSLDNPTGRTATVRGLKPGVTKIICEESCYDSHIAASCTVIVYEPGSRNNPGDIDHDGKVSTDDALLALKHSVGQGAFDVAEEQTADLDQNGSVDADDALLMLKIAVGML